MVGLPRMTDARAGALSGGGSLSVPRSKFGCPACRSGGSPARAWARFWPSPTGGWGSVTGGPATGKTVAVAQWFGSLGPGRPGMGDTDAGDDRPERFWLTFVLALQRAVPGAFAQTEASETHMRGFAAGVSRPVAHRVVSRHRSARHRARRHTSPPDPTDHRGSRLRHRASSRGLENAIHKPGRSALAGQPVAGPGLARRGRPARSGVYVARDGRAVHRARRRPSDYE